MSGKGGGKTGGGWTAAWSTKHERWYYEDRERGLSSWTKPPGCTIDIPTAPPDHVQELAEKRENLAEGWECEWDAIHSRHYYFNRVTKERSWLRPPKAGVTTTASAPAGAAGGKGAGAGKGADGKGGPPSGTTRSAPPPAGAAGVGGRNLAGVAKKGAGTEWYPDDFRQRLAKARQTQDKNYIKSILKEVAENNYALRDKWPVPRTVPVKFEDCMKSRVTGMGRDPEISFSLMTTADAMLWFSQADRNRKVVALNFANGQSVGGGYKNGAMAQEEDLCRRCPTLYTSLYSAKRDGYYPFGPCTCRNPETPGKYSDVLWTPGVAVARGGEADGFAIIPKEHQANVSLVAAAAPNIRFADPPEFSSKELMLNTIKATLIAPLMMQPDITTMILGAWGCGAFGGDPYEICELFIKALIHERHGRLYKEIHFAIPRFADDKNADVFREVLRKHNVKFKEIS